MKYTLKVVREKIKSDLKSDTIWVYIIIINDNYQDICR